jgi:hypothetical protein
VARYRLRFLLQEFDLPRGATLLGRSSECHVTIEDPLVSRRHARIVVEGDVATVADLESRNGVKVNGAAVREPVVLQDGDRVRIGTQELVFCRIETAQSTSRTTGFLSHCAQCRMPYPREAGACPNCGSTLAAEEDTATGQGADDNGSWSLQLLIEVLEKSMSLGKMADSDRILRRATAQLEERLVDQKPIDPVQLSTLARIALTLSVRAADSTWAVWAMGVHRRAGVVPSDESLRALTDAVPHVPDLRDSAADLSRHFHGLAGSLGDDDRRRLSILDRIRSSFPGGVGRANLS